MREAIASGADVIKVVVDVGPTVLSVEELRAVVEEARRAGRKVAAHATSRAAVAAAVEAGVDSIEHGTEADEETLRKMKERGVALVINVYTERTLRDLFAAELRRSPEAVADFEGYLTNAQEIPAASRAPRRASESSRAPKCTSSHRQDARSVAPGTRTLRTGDSRRSKSSAPTRSTLRVLGRPTRWAQSSPEDADLGALKATAKSAQTFAHQIREKRRRGRPHDRNSTASGEIGFSFPNNRPARYARGTV